MFLVVEDQLRVSEGWVRCGRCANVFNAVDDLIDVELGTPVQLDIDSLQAGARLSASASASIDTGKGAAVPGQALGTATPPGTESWTLEPADRPPRSPARPASGPPEPPAGPPAPVEAPFEAPFEARFVPPAVAASAAARPGTLPPQTQTAVPTSASAPGRAGPMPGTAATSSGSAGTGAPADAADRSSAKRRTRGPGPAPTATPSPGPAADPRSTASGNSIERAASVVPTPSVRNPAPDHDHDRGRDSDSDLPDHLLRLPSESFDDDSAAPSSIGVSQGWSTISSAESAEGTPSRRKARPSSLPPADAAPSFVREAERAQRWQRSPLRPALRLGAGLLALLAGLQGALLFRDPLAAQMPALAPALQAGCAPLGCSVQPLRRIERLAVDSSGLTRVDDGTDPSQHRYRLAVLLHNKAATALMAPAIELTLTDTRGEIVARRVLQMTDFGQPAGPIAPGQEMPLRVLLATGPQPVEGYTVEIFYP